MLIKIVEFSVYKKKMRPNIGSRHLNEKKKKCGKAMFWCCDAHREQYKYVDHVSMKALGLLYSWGVQLFDEICIFWQQMRSAMHWVPFWSGWAEWEWPLANSRIGNETLTNMHPYSTTLCERSVELLWCCTCFGCALLLLGLRPWVTFLLDWGILWGRERGDRNCSALVLPTLIEYIW
jgi:hypothetical protein